MTGSTIKVRVGQAERKRERERREREERGFPSLKSTVGPQTNRSKL